MAEASVRLEYSHVPFWKNTALPFANSARDSSPVLAASSEGAQVALFMYRSQMFL